MRNKKIYALVITFLTISSIFIGLGSIIAKKTPNFNLNFEDFDELDKLMNAGRVVIYSNDTEIFRLFETVNITVDVSNYSPANYTEIQIPYLNNTVYNFNMTWVKDQIFSYNFSPEENTSYNLQQINFLVYDVSGNLLNTEDEYLNIIILPNCVLTFNNNTTYKNDLLSAVISPSSASNNTFDWNNWNVSIVNDAYSELFSIDGNNINSFMFTINDSFNQLNSYYYAKVNLYKDYALRGSEYYRFQVLNHAPEIDESSISFDSNSIFRTESCTISLNASDLEDDSPFLDVSLTLKSPDGQTIVPLGVITNNGDGSFTRKIITSSDMDTGIYTIEIIVEDSLGETSRISYATFTVNNNPPKIDSYSINGYPTSQGISILYGQNLVFSFNVSDVEGIAYIRVALIDENNQWYNITQPYETNVEITVRTAQLITGLWYIYVFVIDTDGSITGLGSDYNAAPQSIRIIPDVLSALLPWIALIIGLIIGIIVGVGAGYYRIKSKLVESQGTTVKKKAPAPKKPLPKRKPHSKTEPIDDDTEDKPKVYEKKELEKKPPQRKIKRKL